MGTSVIKFIERNAPGHPRKRRQNRHACEDCRKRKVSSVSDYPAESFPSLDDLAAFFARTAAAYPLPHALHTYGSSVSPHVLTLRIVERRCLHDYDEARREMSSPPTGENMDPHQPSHQPRIDDSSKPHELPGEQTGAIVDDRPTSRNSSLPGSVGAESGDIDRDSRHSSDQPEDEHRPNFVGDLNPEGIFLATTSHGASRVSKYHDNLGFWLPSKDPSQSGGSGPSLPGPRPDASSVAHPNDSRAATHAWSSRSARLLPDPRSFNSLRTIYFKDIHPIFPILPPELVPEMADSGELSMDETILMQSLCFATATNTAARPFLRLPRRRGVLSPKEFSARQSQALVASLNTAYGAIDPMIAVRAFGLLSLFSQLSTDNHTSAEYCARAVSHVHTMQLHLDTSHVRKDDAVAVQIFLCVWVIDRLNAAFQSRPILMHSRDIGRDMAAAVAQQQGCFRTLLVICNLLEKVTGLYRPESKANDDEAEFPPFEELVIGTDAVRCPASLLGESQPFANAPAGFPANVWSPQEELIKSRDP